MQARSARLRALPSSRRLSTTTPRFSNVSETLRRASASGPRPMSPPRSDRSSIPRRSASARADHSRPRRAVVASARGSLRRRDALDPRHPPRRRSWIVVRAHRVLRPRARDDPRRRPRPRDPIQNGSDYGLTAGLQSLDPDEIARWTERVRGRQPLRQPRHHWRHRAPPTLWRLEALCRRPDCQGGWPELRQHPRSVAGHRRRRRHGHDCLPAMDERHRTPRARPVRTLCRTKRTSLPSTVRRSVDPVRVERVDREAS